VRSQKWIEHKIALLRQQSYEEIGQLLGKGAFVTDVSRFRREMQHI
jgi:hypothetical protein